MFTKGYKISLKALRINSDFSIEEVANLLDVSRDTVEAWERYDSFPTPDQAKNLALLYKVDIQDLIFGKFKTAKEIFYRNKEMLKKAEAEGYGFLRFSEDGEIIGFRKNKDSEFISA